MAVKIKILDVSVQTRRDVVEETDAPGRTRPLFLGSKFDGTTQTINCVVSGANYDEAKAFIDTLQTMWEANQKLWINPAGVYTTQQNVSYEFGGAVEGLSYGLRPNNKHQRFSITLRTGNE